MYKKLFFSVILAMALVFGMTVVTCGGGGGGGGDPLNGTWVNGSGADRVEITIKNGSWETKFGSIKAMRGSFTTESRSITYILFEAEQVHGDYLNDTQNAGAESKWYSKNDLKKSYPASSDSAIDSFFPTFDGEYNGDTLTLGAKTYTKQGGSSGGGSSKGTFTLTGIPSKYDGKYAILIGYPEENDLMIMMGCDLNMSKGTVTAVKISGGKVDIPVYVMKGSDFPRYSGNGTAEQVTVQILNSANVDFASIMMADPDDHLGGFIDMVMYNAVEFSNGGATKSWSQADIIFSEDD